MHNSAQNLITLNSDRAKKITFKRSESIGPRANALKMLQDFNLVCPSNNEEAFQMEDKHEGPPSP